MATKTKKTTKSEYSPIRQKLTQIEKLKLTSWPILTEDQSKTNPFSPTKDKYAYLARVDLMVVNDADLEEVLANGWCARECTSSVYGVYTLLEKDIYTSGSTNA